MSLSVQERNVDSGGGETGIEYPNFANAMESICTVFQHVKENNLPLPF